jgi:hypothetical protein
MSNLTKRVDALERAGGTGAQGIVCIYYPGGGVVCDGRFYADEDVLLRVLEQRAGGETAIYRIPDNGRE